MESSSKDVNARGLPDKNNEVDTPPPLVCTDQTAERVFVSCPAKCDASRQQHVNVFGRCCPPQGTERRVQRRRKCTLLGNPARGPARHQTSNKSVCGARGVTSGPVSPRNTLISLRMPNRCARYIPGSTENPTPESNTRSSAVSKLSRWGPEPCRSRSIE